VDCAASRMVVSSESEAARRFGSGTSRRGRARSDIACVRTPSHSFVDGRTRRGDYSSAAWIESGRHARSVGPCLHIMDSLTCKPWSNGCARPRSPLRLMIGCCRSEEHTSELQSRRDLVCRLLLEKKKRIRKDKYT